MKKSICIFGIALACLTASSCATDKQDQVYSVVNARSDNDGKTLTVSGLLKVDNGYYNLFSRDQKECIGLLLTDSQRESYRSLINRRVAATGKFSAEGCGRAGICVEHICGPAILTDVAVAPAS